MTSAADLFALQEIDLQRDARRAIIADIEARLGETEELVEARESVDDSAFALERLQKRQREFDAQLQDLDAKIGPLETKLYDGSVRNPKELTDLQKELDMFKANRSRLDEQGIQLMESLDTATQALAAAKRELAEIETAWKSSQTQMAADKVKSEGEYESLDGQRKVHTTGMDASVLGLYEVLRTKKQGRAVARVERGICQGCRLTLPSHLNQRIRGGDTLVQCPSCERILVAG
jgi:predicted  nucleic acid-binding Zn-ribbon protein